ncbi:MAG: PAS domain-containing sensor histidine kinase, partial [Deltaproteobacteria bacterium]|nr:PAS domain-containing sensor histidine kinase [Deltaproteobacteria bacterium]
MSKKTREMIFVAFILTVIVLLSVFKTNLSDLGLIRSGNAVIFTVISLNVVLLILVVFLVTRNFVKLMLERKRGVLGTRLRTKLVAAFVTLTIIPTAVLFFTSVVFLNRSMEGWLSSEVERAIEESMNVANIYYKE